MPRRRKPLAHESGRRAAQREQRRAITAPLAGAVCQARPLGGCMGPIVGHEVVKRSQVRDAHMDPRLVIGVCAAHNSWVEDNPYEAQIAGLSVPGWVWRNDGEDALVDAARRRTSLWTGTPMAPPWWLNLR